MALYDSDGIHPSPLGTQIAVKTIGDCILAQEKVRFPLGAQGKDTGK
jgi:hypothetical protein